MPPDAEKKVPPAAHGEQSAATAFSAGELRALRYVSQGKVHRAYLPDPLIADLVKLRLVDVSGAFLCATELGLEILATTYPDDGAP